MRQFAEAADRPPVDLLTEIRRDHAVHRLGQNLQSVAAIGEAVGYLSEAALQRACRRHTGFMPARYRAAQLRPAAD
ncbi:helix-turn-helix domain-containing protein [Roseateles toxinivorans]|uniref:helix-turn-helix domain-containing protein n=1 Tax=Roseateles toxinivorans TaxID=270368 RepID=UPI00141522EA|nr:helix-turn-helix domain-containing protein [Roseateles toxinivorans]